MTDNAINRVLRAHNLPSLDSPGVVVALAYQVQDHVHFAELLRACEPALRREMYEAMSPHLKFPAKALDQYIATAQELAAAAELPTMNSIGGLDPFKPAPSVTTEPAPEIELLAFCSRCDAEAQFTGERLADAIFSMRRAGWAYDSSTAGRHLCPECLDRIA